MTLTLCAFCGMILDVEDQSYKCSSWAKLPSVVLRDPRQVTNCTQPAGVLLSCKADGQGVVSTKTVLTHGATEAHRAMTTLPNDSSPRQLHLFDPIQIPLTKGQVALIDPIDADLAIHKWQADKAKEYGYYAFRYPGSRNRRVWMYMHRVIMERILGRPLTRDEHVDHADGNRLNNTRANLRIATRQQNIWNSRRPRTNRSGYKGVYWDKREQKWTAAFGLNGKHIHLGRFATAEEAHAAYLAAAQKYAGEFARGE